jgi:tRNA U34 5-carboxymethylaminomethyl modifying enzyme MnmG/GidA
MRERINKINKKLFFQVLETRLRNDGLYSLTHAGLDEQAKRMKENSQAELPPELDYWRLKELSMEAR